MKLLIANWKLNPNTIKEAQKLASEVSRARAVHKVVICPPTIFLPVIKTKFDLGAQDIFWEQAGPYTSQTSPLMLKQFKVKYAIVGHSDRRGLGETDEQVNLKVKAAIANKITPVLCVGFGLTAEMSEEEVLTHLQQQLSAGLKDADAKKVIVAYEPVWALSAGDPYKTKKVPTGEHAERIAMFVRIKFKVAKVLYGGSSNASNEKDFLERQIDGLLVGGASLNSKEFIKMISTKI